jgi:hypothetical protein
MKTDNFRQFINKCTGMYYLNPVLRLKLGLIYSKLPIRMLKIILPIKRYGTTIFSCEWKKQHSEDWFTQTYDKGTDNFDCLSKRIIKLIRKTALCQKSLCTRMGKYAFGLPLRKCVSFMQDICLLSRYMQWIVNWAHISYMARW